GQHIGQVGGHLRPLAAGVGGGVDVAGAGAEVETGVGGAVGARAVAEHDPVIGVLRQPLDGGLPALAGVVGAVHGQAVAGRQVDLLADHGEHVARARVVRVGDEGEPEVGG